jgi:hypothetical protein
LVPAVRELIGDADTQLALPLRRIIAAACDEIGQIKQRLDQVERELAALARQIPAVALLMTAPGIGLIIATALVAFVGDMRRFPSSRHLASYLVSRSAAPGSGWGSHPRQPRAEQRTHGRHHQLRCEATFRKWPPKERSLA